MIIGLTGVAGSGKSTAAKILSRDFNFARRPFAYPLKAMIAALGVPAEVLDGPREFKEAPLAILNGRTARHAMQTLGTEWARAHMGDDFWVKLWMRKADHLGHIVADDVRFPNEAEAIRSLGGRVFRIERAGAGDRVNPGHVSEAIHDLVVDGVIRNYGSEDNLRDLLREVAA